MTLYKNTSLVAFDRFEDAMEGRTTFSVWEAALSVHGRNGCGG